MRDGEGYRTEDRGGEVVRRSAGEAHVLEVGILDILGQVLLCAA
jgi:hypothetical protein